MTEKSLDNNNNNKIFRNIVYSSLATSIAELATLPICTIKTNYQNTHSNSIINTAKSIYSRGGIKPFYAASVPAIFGQVFQQLVSILFIVIWILILIIQLKINL